MTMTAYDIIAELSLTPDQYFRCEVLRRYLGGVSPHPELVHIMVRPLRYTDHSKTFAVPAKEAQSLARELNAIFEAARKLTA